MFFIETMGTHVGTHNVLLFEQSILIKEECVCLRTSWRENCRAFRVDNCCTYVFSCKLLPHGAFFLPKSLYALE